MLCLLSWYRLAGLKQPHTSTLAFLAPQRVLIGNYLMLRCSEQYLVRWWWPRWRGKGWREERREGRKMKSCWETERGKMKRPQQQEKEQEEEDWGKRPTRCPPRPSTWGKDRQEGLDLLQLSSMEPTCENLKGHRSLLAYYKTVLIFLICRQQSRQHPVPATRVCWGASRGSSLYSPPPPPLLP